MDGVRAYWTGKEMISKQGNEIRVPEFFRRDLPKVALDGELWIGRGSFERLLKAIKSNSEEDWRSVKYAIFDLPGSADPIESRLEALQQLPLPPHVLPLRMEECRGVAH